MAIFGPKHWVFGQQNEICGQNATRDLFLYHQKGAACKIWANSDGSFSRSGVEWNKRLKLNFWYRTRAGGPTPPSKVRVDRWGRPPRRARLNRWLGARRWSKLVKIFCRLTTRCPLNPCCYNYWKKIFSHRTYLWQERKSTATLALQNAQRVHRGLPTCRRRWNNL